MSPLILLRMSGRALGRQPLRSALTIAGIAIGIAAVMLTVALGEGSAAAVHQQFLNLGDNFVWVENGGANVGGVRTGAAGVARLTPEDSEAIVAEVPEIARCSPSIDGRAQIVRGNRNWNTSYRGVSPDYLEIKAWPVVAGASYSDADIQSRARVAILGQTVVHQLFDADEDPIGQDIRVGSVVFTVVGVLKFRGTSTTGQDQDDTLFIPYTTVQHILRGSLLRVDDIMCSATSAENISPAQSHITDVLRIRHGIDDGTPDDFNLRSPEDSIRLQEASAHTLELTLSGVASVSLLVGGVGIMNIMLVSVAERTREIGLRLAIGAKGFHVRAQFLTEALLLGLAGGVSGVVLGLASEQLFTDYSGIAMTASPETIALATVFAAGVGVVFGYYPARHASLLDPIEALRAE